MCLIRRGLGKSIQAIALMWTALRQGPTGNPVARKAVIVCPSSLVGNWAKELDKWLQGRLKPMCLGESTKKALGKISDFQFKPEYDVLIISYDQLKIHSKELAKVWNIGKSNLHNALQTWSFVMKDID